MHIYGYSDFFSLHTNLKDLYVIYIETILVKWFWAQKNEILILSFVNWRSKTVYAVGEFLDDNSVAVVPNNWIIEEGKKCHKAYPCS